MKRTMGRLLALVVAVSCCLSVAGNAAASTKASYYLTAYNLSLAAVSGGGIEIRFNVVANQSVNELGADYILLEESSDGGRTWSVAAEYERERWMTGLHCQTFQNATIYPGTVGYRYRATADVIAYNSVSAQDTRTIGPCTWVTAKN